DFYDASASYSKNKVKGSGTTKSISVEAKVMDYKGGQVMLAYVNSDYTSENGLISEDMSGLGLGYRYGNKDYYYKGYVALTDTDFKLGSAKKSIGGKVFLFTAGTRNLTINPFIEYSQLSLNSNSVTDKYKIKLFAVGGKYKKSFKDYNIGMSASLNKSKVDFTLVTAVGGQKDFSASSKWFTKYTPFIEYKAKENLLINLSYSTYKTNNVRSNTTTLTLKTNF
ncbi:MAG: hypothetical protein ACPG8V_05290, partial [Alphaproteobacteria bacterium]